MNPFVERHHDEIAGVISCFDRVVISGTLLDIGHAQAMSGYLTYLGDRSHLQVHVPGLGHPLSVARQNVLPLLHGTRANEDALWLSWPVEAAVLLPPE